ncbi:MAG: hypothetical protein ACO1Q7_18980 [Gemmatimonas sp.]
MRRPVRPGLLAVGLISAIFSAAAGLGACALWPDGPFPPKGGERIAERPEYLLWWKLVEDCSGRRRRMDVQWYSTNGQLIEHGDVLAAGLFRPYPDRIALVDPSNGPVARHEMLHAILERSGHPLPQYAGTCAGIVDFDGPIAYGLADVEIQSAVPMRSDSAVTLSVRTIPESPSQAAFGGKFVFLVEVKNRTNKYVMVDQFLNRNVTVQFADSSGLNMYSQRLSSHGLVYFAPGQTRRVIVDSKIGRTGPVNVTVSYGRARSDPVRVVFQK